MTLSPYSRYYSSPNNSTFHLKFQYTHQENSNIDFYWCRFLSPRDDSMIKISRFQFHLSPTSRESNRFSPTILLLSILPKKKENNIKSWWPALRTQHEGYVYKRGALTRAFTRRRCLHPLYPCLQLRTGLWFSTANPPRCPHAFSQHASFPPPASACPRSPEERIVLRPGSIFRARWQ